MRPATLTRVSSSRTRLMPAALLSLAFLLAPVVPAAAAEKAPAPVAAAPVSAAPAAAAAQEQPSPITDEAQRIFQAYGDAVYQVQTIDLASDKKSSIGSGFQFTKDGLIATNYHVVAEAVQRPSTNRLEYLQEKGGRGQLKILIADVVHDLAILKMDKPGDTFVELGSSSLPKGAGLFSLGNPHDIGLSILPGTNNGRNEESFVEKIHFSGALNPGMSGGPVLAHNGKVVGINVSTQGNQIGFLVPVEPLRDLFQEYQKQDSKFDFIAHADEILQKQLLAGQQKNVDRMLKAKWESVPFGPFTVPGRITEAFKCWGESNRQEKNPYYTYHSTCFSQDRQFLDEDSGSGEAFYTGSYFYRYDSIVPKPELNLARFYSLYEAQYGQPMQAESTPAKATPPISTATAVSSTCRASAGKPLSASGATRNIPSSTTCISTWRWSATGGRA